MFVVYRYGKYGVADIQYVRLRKHGRLEWTRFKHSASKFRDRARAEAFARGYHSVRNDEDLVVERA